MRHREGLVHGSAGAPAADWQPDTEAPVAGAVVGPPGCTCHTQAFRVSTAPHRAPW